MVVPGRSQPAPLRSGNFRRRVAGPSWGGALAAGALLTRSACRRRNIRPTASGQIQASRDAVEIELPDLQETASETAAPNEGTIPSPSTAEVLARRAARIAEYDELKKQAQGDAAVVGAVGALITLLSAGSDAAAGFVLGSAAAVVYLKLLMLDVDRLGVNGGPFDVLNPLRLARLLVPVLLVVALCSQAIATLGFDQWLAGIRWEPGLNIVNAVTSPAVLYASMLGFLSGSAPLRLRALVRDGPGAKDVFQLLPGSLGVAAKLADGQQKQRGSAGAIMETAPQQPPVVVSVLIISGPRNCGKTTLVQRLKKADPRFLEPEWIIAAGDGAPNVPAAPPKERLCPVSEAEYKTVEDAGVLAVNYSPYDEDGTQIGLGLPALNVLTAAERNGACVLDVDAPTARALLSYPWEERLQPFIAPDSRVEMRFVTVWVTLPLDDIVERSRVLLEKNTPGGFSKTIMQRQLALVRSQAAADTEWALVSGSFDFTVKNTDLEAAMKEITRAAGYCFTDPF